MRSKRLPATSKLSVKYSRLSSWLQHQTGTTTLFPEIKIDLLLQELYLTLHDSAGLLTYPSIQYTYAAFHLS